MIVKMVKMTDFCASFTSKYLCKLSLLHISSKCGWPHTFPIAILEFDRYILYWTTSVNMSPKTHICLFKVIF